MGRERNRVEVHEHVAHDRAIFHHYQSLCSTLITRYLTQLMENDIIGHSLSSSLPSFVLTTTTTTTP